MPLIGLSLWTASVPSERHSREACVRLWELAIELFRAGSVADAIDVAAGTSPGQRGWSVSCEQQFRLFLRCETSFDSSRIDAEVGLVRQRAGEE